MKRIGITIGDINGIGPEVVLKAMNQDYTDEVEFILYGSASILHQQADAMGLTLCDKLSIVDVGEATWQPGVLDVEAARLAEAAIQATVEACMQDECDAMVTAPLSKEGLLAAKIAFPGHTEMLAALTQSKQVGMMLIGGGLRVVLATRHIALSTVAEAITPAVLREAVSLTDEALAWFGEGREIGVCGLNPHAGDGGVLGEEEQRIINPTLMELRNEGYAVSDALAGDTLFYQAQQGAYDAVIAMYHDQGLAPLKLVAFDEGVNLTLGLPIVRTSPDHGTAYSIAGKNQASPGSMIAAIRTAIALADKHNPWHRKHN